MQAKIEAENAALRSKVEKVRSMTSKTAKGGDARDLEGEIAEIEKLREQNEELRRLAEERLQALALEGGDEGPLANIAEPKGAAEEKVAEAAPAEDVALAPEPSVPTAAAPATVASTEAPPLEEASASLAAKEAEDAAAEDAAAAVAREIADHNPNDVVRDRAHWLYFFVPEHPQAGCPAVLYFNRKSSAVLRDSPTVKCLLGW